MTALCIVVKAFPRLSETFIARELEALEDRGLTFQIASLRAREKTADLARHRVRATVDYLPEYLHEHPWRVIGSWRRARSFPGYAEAWRAFRADFRRDASRNRIRRFGQACVLAAELPEDVRHIHAHFAHTPASVARYAAIIRGLSFSMSAHAKDIWTSPDWDLRDKLHKARFCAVCNAAGAERLKALAPDSGIKLWPHLLDEAPQPMPRSQDGTVRLVTVARAVPKKGLGLLLDALASLPEEPNWTWTHIGGGPELDALRDVAARHRFASRLALLGPQPHARVLEVVAASDIFVLPAQIAADGDRDGRPNALLEAMSMGLACVAAPAGGVAELIRDGEDGMLCAAEPERLAEALRTLMNDANLRGRLGAAAQSRSRELATEGRAAVDALAAALRALSQPDPGP
jgi:glycosyltransferase involved in cell wall biosynthesis